MEATIFDIDGTLIDSFTADAGLYLAAVSQVLAIADVSAEWASYRHVTDQGCLKEIMEVHGSRLLASPSRYVAYATGAWRESALVKLESAGLPTEGIVLSTSSEFEDRVSMMKGALAAAPSGIRKIAYYGDAVWDQKAVAALVAMTPEGIDVEHIPLLLSDSGGTNQVLRGHVARANPVWQKVGDGSEVLAIFQGPDHYVSPNWYPSKREHGKVVPTWNNVVVHVLTAIVGFEIRISEL